MLAYQHNTDLSERERGVIFGGNFKETKSHYLEEPHNYTLWLSISQTIFGPVKLKMPNEIGSHYDLS